MTINLKKLGVREMLNQRVLSRLDGDRLGDAVYLKELGSLVSAGVGGFVLFGGEYWEVKKALHKLQSKTKFPLIVASDMERGAGQQLNGATGFPCQMAVAAATDLVSGEGRGLVSEMMEAVAFEARCAGVNAVLSPVLDVNSNPDNPIICTRAFSDDPLKVSVLGEAYIAGLQGGKYPVMACAKHFPGHGEASQDSHTSLPRLEKDRQGMEDEDMLPFRKAIMSKVEMVMAGHLLVPEIDQDYPASLSKKLIRDYLRTRSGFEGLVLTDAFNMGALCKEYTQREAARLAVKAGADILLHPSDAASFMGELASLAAEKGVTKEEALAPSARLARVKAKYCQPVRIADSLIMERMAGNRELAAVIAERAMTLVKAEGAFPSLKDFSGTIAHVALDDDDDRMSGWIFRSELKRRKKKLKNFYVPRSGAARLKTKALTAARAAQLTVLSVFSDVAAGKGRSGLSPELGELAVQLVKKSKRTVVVSFGSPYMLKGMMDADIVVAAYDQGEAMQRAACRAFFGEIIFRGNLPVRI